jgi:hypothetical protein
VSDANSAMGYGVEMLPHVMENYHLPKECFLGVCPVL